MTDNQLKNNKEALIKANMYNEFGKFVETLRLFKELVCDTHKSCLGCRLNEECNNFCRFITLFEFLKRCQREVGVFVGVENLPDELPNELNVFPDDDEEEK
jgi:hypothetical protein